MQYLLLARHGNTFAPDQKVVWVGARNNLPLVASGINQANNLAEALKNACVKPDQIYAATLERTVAYAKIIHDQLKLSKDVKLDDRLNEIDYGEWSGLTSDEIKMQFSEDELIGWNEKGLWPKTFVGSELNMESQIESFVNEVLKTNKHIRLALAVTSNGRLKYFLKLIPESYKKYVCAGKWKVSTGNICILGYEAENWHLLCWNEKANNWANWSNYF